MSDLDLSQLGQAIAYIDEQACIGCTLCLHACPVDAIIGAAKLMHTVISAECTGCQLCLPPCPVNCIEMKMQMVASEIATGDYAERAALARRRYAQRQQRLQQAQHERQQRRARRQQQALRQSADADPRQAVIAAAVARVKAKKAARLKQAIKHLPATSAQE